MTRQYCWPKFILSGIQFQYPQVKFEVISKWTASKMLGILKFTNTGDTRITVTTDTDVWRHCVYEKYD